MREDGNTRTLLTSRDRRHGIYMLEEFGANPFFCCWTDGNRLRSRVTRRHRYACDYFFSIIIIISLFLTLFANRPRVAITTSWVRRYDNDIPRLLRHTTSDGITILLLLCTHSYTHRYGSKFYAPHPKYHTNLTVILRL